MLENKKICFLGAGSMAEAIIAGLVAKELVTPKNISALNRGNRDRIEQLIARYGINDIDKETAITSADIIVLAVKPKDIDSALSEYTHLTHKGQLFISVLAGISTDYITSILGHEAPVIRSMPNTSATIGLSATGIASGKTALEESIAIAKQLFEAIGIVEQVEEEEIHGVTGLSGSGPAYIYYLVEAMEKAGQDIGLDQDVARRLILQTILGSVEMLMQSNESAESLRKKVTSPNGTTAAGIDVLNQYKFAEAIGACIRRATERSRELGALTNSHS
ncbi:MAG TPA: pyrroline-5-carboxylate reductase [Paenibacillaceae bacterium]|nr:pyrroline-5-carboxylate reductase [Paenibacillaceae bacterium]